MPPSASRRPTVSVAMATFNGACYVEAQLRSILEQERPPDEIVVSDGGSHDATVEIVRRVLGAQSSIMSKIVADGERLDVTANFARALAVTSGDFIALSDQDDTWHPDRLRRGVEAFDGEVLLTHSDARLVDVDGADMRVRLFDALGVSSRDLERLAGDEAFALLIRRNVVTGATAMISRRLLDLALPFPGSWIHDEWLAAIASAIGRVAPSPDALIDYRQHGANAIGVTTPTIRYRMRRMLKPREDRYRRLAIRAGDLVDRLDTIGAPDRWRDLSRRKREFEKRRSRYSPSRLLRTPAVLGGALRGDYRDLSSQRDLDILRDILQPA